MDGRTKAASGITQALAAQVVALRLAEMPDRVQTLARLALLDWYAVTHAGAGIAPVPILAAEIAREGGTARARLIGRACCATAAQAALHNGTAGHVLDYDDVHNAVPGHVTINIAPAVLALGEEIGATGAEVLCAFVAGFELMCRIGQGFESQLFHRGWQGTVLGAVCAAAACAKLLRLDLERTRMAMALGVAQASGVHGNYGSMTKCLNVGIAAQAGLRAARWAADGITGRPDILERDKGLIEVYGDTFDAAAALADPEGGWHLHRHLFKVHASCFLTHGALMAWDALSREHGLRGADVVRTQVTVEGARHRILLTDPPRDGLEAKFNLPFCLAMAMQGLDLSDPATFSAETTARDDLQRAAAQIEVIIDPDLWFEAARLDLTLTDGRQPSARADAGRPVADLDALVTAVENKARRLIALPDGQSDDLIARFRAFATLVDLRDLHPAAPGTGQEGTAP